MKIEWLVDNVTAAESPRTCYFGGGWFRAFFGQLRPLLWSVGGGFDNVTAVGSPYKAEHDILGMILDFFGQFRPLLWSGGYFVMCRVCHLCLELCSLCHLCHLWLDFTTWKVGADTCADLISLFCTSTPPEFLPPHFFVFLANFAPTPM